MAKILYHGDSDIVRNGLPQLITGLQVDWQLFYGNFEGAVRRRQYDAIVMALPTYLRDNEQLPRRFREDPENNLDAYVDRLIKMGANVPIVFTRSTAFDMPEINGASFAKYNISWIRGDYLSAVRELSDEVEKVLAERPQP